MIRSLALGFGVAISAVPLSSAWAQCQPTQEAKLNNAVYVSPGIAQYWYRDPADPYAVGLTNALSFQIQP